MKKLLLMFSVTIMLLLPLGSGINTSAQEQQESNGCTTNLEESTVRIVNNYNIFSANGLIYRTDDEYSYIVTSSDLIKSTNSYKIIYEGEKNYSATLLGKDEYNQIAVLKVAKDSQERKSACFANSNYLYKGQRDYAYGYTSISKQLKTNVIISEIGYQYYYKEYIGIYKNIIQIASFNGNKSIATFDEEGRVTGIISECDSKMSNACYVTEANKIIKVADSIAKTGKYSPNYIKYSMEDYSNLSIRLKNKYKVGSSVNTGVVITSFKPFNYIFGGLNQGMTIVAVNEVKINSIYELDKQFSRYEKKATVTLQVITSNGKEEIYYVNL